MKNLVTIGIILLCAYTSIAQTKENTWLFKDSQNDLTFNFEEEVFKIDTLVTIEGHIYVFSFTEDSSYIRLNYINANAKFECCDKDNIYKEIRSCKINGITDRLGMVIGSDLHWRAIRNDRLDIIYNYCPKEKLEYFNRIIDSLVEQL